MSISSRAAVRGEPDVMRGRTPAPAATQPHANIWNGVHGPNPPQSTDESAIVSIPRRKPNLAPKTRPARIRMTKTASRPPTPVLAILIAAATAVSTPSMATVVALFI